MANYRQHLGFASALGVGYAVGVYCLAGIHWLYGSAAFLLSALGGLLPDVDSDSGVEMRTFTGVLGVLAAVAVWKGFGSFRPGLPFELHLWGMVFAYVAVRHGLRLVVGRLTVHRGMSHSLPTCLVWGCLAYLHYPSRYHVVRLAMAAALMLGFVSHLLLDELCSVDLRGARLKTRSFGTALKLWAASPWSTLLVYGLLAYLSHRVIEIWPDGSDGPLTQVPAPRFEGAVRQAQAAVTTFRR